MRSEFEDSEFTAAILRRTSGSVCDSARDRLCGWADQTLDATDQEIVSVHLEHCAACAALARALAAMRSELPRLSQRDPDPVFVQRVLACTISAGHRAPFAERFLAVARRLLDRPRIALEGAFVGAMLLVLPFGTLHDRGRAGATTLEAIRHASSATSASLGSWVRAARGTFSSDAASGQPRKEKR